MHSDRRYTYCECDQTQLYITQEQINVKKAWPNSLKQCLNGDTAYITQLKAKIKRCYYFCSTSP